MTLRLPHYWLIFALFGGLFPALLIALVNLGGEGEALAALLTYSFVPSIAFGIFCGIVGDLVLDGYYPGHEYAVPLFLVGCFVVAGLGAAATRDFISVQNASYIYKTFWILGQLVITIIVLMICFRIKDKLFTRRV